MAACLMLPSSICSRGKSSPPAVGPSEALIVDADFPGGNIILDRIEGDTVFLKPDLRDTSTWWFYWHFRVRATAGRTVKFQFVGRSPIGTRGPAVSTDGGRNWTWLDPEAAGDSSFSYVFDKKARDVRFCFAVPYLEANLQRFLKKHADNSHLAVRELCRSRKRRPIERLHVGKIHGDPKYRVLLTARHHACEMIASYSLEGLLETALSDTALGRWFQGNVEVLVVPFVDKDGVEDGDQGKNRKPHDHNRDYAGQSIYPCVAALRRFVPEWSDEKLKVVLDLHCPYISGKQNEVIYLVGSSDPAIWKQQQKFGAILESAREGPLPYSAGSSLPFGTGWNTAANYGKQKSCSRWGSEQPGVLMSSTIEIPYANVGAVLVTTENARAFGRDLARALRRYLESSGGEGN
ncbi:MAG: M14 family zinc carboxypeptidase [Planctomycetota bacterium]